MLQVHNLVPFSFLLKYCDIWFSSWFITLYWRISERMRKILLEPRLLKKCAVTVLYYTTDRDSFWAEDTDVCCFLSHCLLQFACCGCECPPPVRGKNARHYWLRLLLWKDTGTNLMKALFILCTIQSVFKMPSNIRTVTLQVCPVCLGINSQHWFL